jgi:cell division protein ZapA (FtsZ GTPase activity inhibitor)
MSELTISVIIADRQYKLTINLEEEENVRKAASLLNGTIKDFAQNYSFKDKQDLLAMAALQYTTELLNKDREINSESKEIKDTLTEIDGVLTQMMK